MNSASTSTIHEELETGDKTARDITSAENLIFKTDGKNLASCWQSCLASVQPHPFRRSKYFRCQNFMTSHNFDPGPSRFRIRHERRYILGTVAIPKLGQKFVTKFRLQPYARWLIADGLGIPGDNGQMSWVAAGFSITTGSFVLVGGRLGDVYGHRLIWLLALVWSMIWNLVSGFARSPAFYDAARGLAGIGTGLMLPTAVARLGQAYPPGQKRNLAFGLFGALAHSAGQEVLYWVLLAQHCVLLFPIAPKVPTHTALSAIKNAMNLAIAIPGIPITIGVGLGGDVDWLGAFLGVAGLILFNFSFNQAPLVGWASPSVIAPLVIGTVTLLLFAVWEIKGAKSPILPFSIWRGPTFLAVMVSAFLSFMSFGIFIFYHIQFIHDFRGASALQAIAWLAPFTIDGFIAACLAAVLINRVPAQVIICGALIAVMVANILTMTAPVSGSYWTAPFFAALFASFGPDMSRFEHRPPQRAGYALGIVAFPVILGHPDEKNDNQNAQYRHPTTEIQRTAQSTRRLRPTSVGVSFDCPTRGTGENSGLGGTIFTHVIDLRG
ncbi:major facilitator superfamily domain-containing protein [Mycena albidolilacea]|uniref:Major facilitator superfamily domain-containing protein n=1 Tax=Mycena albidolilacea TaxID=1033008 RepID=A0AAD6Z6S6_9AGAR|nr:major facilitator superfamily domain-containing protein [Mycena albidolilacea]